MDFVTHACRRGSWIVVRPGQVQYYDFSTPWNGWLVVFRPEFLLPLQPIAPLADERTSVSVEWLPNHIALGDAEHAAALACVRRMSGDARRDSSAGTRHQLLRYQLYALLLRLDLAHDHDELAGTATPVEVKRFRRFRDAVELDLATTHRIADYARRIGCSEKSLTRAALAVAGVPAKAFLSQRIALEAKRLLAHTAEPVATLAGQLGFDEPTNFVKFFRREAGCTPGTFRARAIRRG